MDTVRPPSDRGQQHLEGGAVSRLAAAGDPDTPAHGFDIQTAQVESKPIAADTGGEVTGQAHKAIKMSRVRVYKVRVAMSSGHYAGVVSAGVRGG
jgi:hypothetical protein